MTAVSDVESYPYGKGSGVIIKAFRPLSLGATLLDQMTCSESVQFTVLRWLGTSCTVSLESCKPKAADHSHPKCLSDITPLHMCKHTHAYTHAYVTRHRPS